MTVEHDVADRVQQLLVDLDHGRVPAEVAAELAGRLASTCAWISFAAAGRAVGVPAYVVRQRADRRSAPLPTRWCGPCRRVRLVDVVAEFRARPPRNARKMLPPVAIAGHEAAEVVEGGA